MLQNDPIKTETNNLNKVIYHLKHPTHPWQPQQPDSHVTKFWVVGSYPMYIYKAVGQFTIFDIKI
jgi:hypothetical protein